MRQNTVELLDEMEQGLYGRKRSKPPPNLFAGVDMAMITSAIQTFKSLITLGSEQGAEPETSNQRSFPCPVCDHKMTLRDEQRFEKFGLADARLHALKCECCGMIADRVYHPSIGYDRTYVA